MVSTRRSPLIEDVQPSSSDDSTALILWVEKCLRAEGLSAAKISVGLSGGLDSVVLLHTLVECKKRIPFTLSAVHVNHGISAHAQQWSEFSRSYADALGVLCHVYHIQLERQGGESLEAIARKARYAIYQQQSCDAIALAHHQDDQAETVLLQLIRGSGVQGLAAMPTKRALSPKLDIIRPFLELPRTVLLSYAKLHQLTWIEDESNQDLHYHRNFLRHEILPCLKTRYPGVAKTLSRAAHYFAQTSTLLADLAKIDCPEMIASHYLSQDSLLMLSPLRQRNVLYWYLRGKGVFPDEKWIIEIQKAIQSSALDKMPTLSVQGKEIYLAHRKLVVVPAFSAPTDKVVIEWRGEKFVDIPAWRGRLYFHHPVETNLTPVEFPTLILKKRQGGEKLKLGPHRPHQTVKNLWQTNRIPSWQRQRLPFIWNDHDLLFVPGAGECYEGALFTQNVQLVWAPWDFPLCVF